VGGSIQTPDIPVPKPTPFGNRLRGWRLEQQLTFRQLAGLVGISPGTLSEIEIGRRDPTDEQRRTIEELMTCPCTDTVEYQVPTRTRPDNLML